MISIRQIGSRRLTPSIAFNLGMLLLFASGIYFHRSALFKQIKPYIQKPIVPGSYAAKPDSTLFVGKEEFINTANAKSSIRILVLGNSVSLHEAVAGLSGC